MQIALFNCQNQSYDYSLTNRRIQRSFVLDTVGMLLNALHSSVNNLGVGCHLLKGAIIPGTPTIACDFHPSLAWSCEH
jgi:hypothetical protein